jgi:hypothetical protein
MQNDILLKKQTDRWYNLIDIPEQVNLVNDNVRFKVVPAGRRSGKTERAKRFIVKKAMSNPGESYFVAAPTRDQVKKIYWQDLKKLAFVGTVNNRRPSETELIIYFENGTTITLIGLDKPERIEGTYWSGGIIDEIANVKDGAWEENISPALDTYDPTRPNYKPWCWLIGVPDGLNHYYDMFCYAESGQDKEWKAYTWKSSDILPADRIAAAKKRMSLRQFKQEYEASFETASGRIYEDYSKLNHTFKEIQPHEQLLWMHDQNFTPLSSAIAVIRENNIYILDEIVLTSAISKQSAQEFCDKYKDHENKNVIIYGDPAGRAGEKHGHESDYTEIETVLREHGWEYRRKVKKQAPAIKDRQNAVRALICNADEERRLFVNPQKAPWSDKGLATVQVKEGSTFIEDQGNKYQHITTAIGYFIDYEFPIRKQLIDMNFKFSA